MMHGVELCMRKDGENRLLFKSRFGYGHAERAARLSRRTAGPARLAGLPTGSRKPVVKVCRP